MPSKAANSRNKKDHLPNEQARRKVLFQWLYWANRARLLCLNLADFDALIAQYEARLAMMEDTHYA